MTDSERLARAVLMFHKGSPWTDEDKRKWYALTNTGEATSRNLCDFARHVLVKEQIRESDKERDRPANRYSVRSVQRSR